MTIRVTATETKARLLALLDQVAQGSEIEITKHGKVVARLVPAPDSASMRGRLSGLAMSVADDDELFSTGEHWNAS